MSKGILVANLKNLQDPTNRKGIFPDNCIKAAENLGLCLVTSTQLFNALILLQQNKLNQKQFWDSIFNGIAICKYPELV
ncbi:hypothetical protein ES703_95775 [subsurface metagenome]